MLASFTWLPFLSPHFPLALICVLVVDLASVLPVPSPAFYLPLCHLPCPPLVSSILLRLIAVQDGFVLVQQHPHEKMRGQRLCWRDRVRATLLRGWPQEWVLMAMGEAARGLPLGSDGIQVRECLRKEPSKMYKQL